MTYCDIFKKRKGAAYRVLCGVLAFTFLFSWALPPGYAQTGPGLSLLNLPAPGTMVSPTPGFTPILVKGIIVHPENPLQFDFIVDPGDSRLKGEELRAESTRLIKYFLASLTVPEDELWVNLSPYEKDRIISDILSQTEMGRDMLAQDYILKQLTASLMYPEKELGRKFWDRVYKKAQEQFGTTEIPLNTFNKVWIVPEKAVVYQHANSAFVVESRLRVMLEQDYVAMNSKVGASLVGAQDRAGTSPAPTQNNISTSIIREIILPEIEREVNEGETFARLRQVYNSMILAAWYKQNLRETLLGQVYVNRARIKGVDVDDKEISQKIYSQYLEAFKKGVYNYIREDEDPATHETIPRKYFSGGVNAAPLFKLRDGVQVRKNPAGLSAEQREELPGAQAFIARTDVVEATDRNAEAVREAEEAAASPIEESPQVGIQKQKENLQRAMREFNGHYYDVVFLAVDEFSYPETVELVERLRGKVIPEQANVQIVRQAEGKINGNWSAIINILLNDEHWNKINTGFYRNIAVILSAGTGTRNYPLTAAGYADKGKQFAANGRTYIEQQFKQIMQYFQEDKEGMVIVSNDGIKAVSKEVKLGDGQEIQFMGSTLPIRDPRLNGLGMALVDGSVTTEGKPLKRFVEKAPPLERIRVFYGIEAKDAREAETAAKRILKAIEAGTEEEKMVPTNWADYNLSLRALEGVRNVYQGLKDAQGVHLYLKYGLDTAGDLFESTTMSKDAYVAKKKKWAAEDAEAVWEAAKKLRDDFGFGFVSTGGKAIFVDTGTNEVFTEAAQDLLSNGDLRELLDVGEPINGRLIGENVVLGKDVKVEEGVVIQGNVVINKGHIKKGAVIINAVVGELYADENTLTYVVEASREVVYVKKNNLVSDIFFKRALYAIPTDIERRPKGRVYDLVTQDAHTPKKRPRIIGTLTRDESGVTLEQPSINLEEISGDESVMKAKIRVHMPLKLTSKDRVREYWLMHQRGVLAQVLSVKKGGGVETIRDYVPYIPLTAALKQQLEAVLGAMVYENFDVIAQDNTLYRVEPVGDASALWDVMVWPRKSEYENRYIWPSREGKVIRLSFAELSQFNDKEATREFLEKTLPEAVHHAKLPEGDWERWAQTDVSLSDLNEDMFRDYDYRNIGPFLKPEAVFRLGFVWADMAVKKAEAAGIPNRRVLVAKDARKIEPELEDALVAALRYRGLDVIYVAKDTPNAVTSYSWAVQQFKPLMSIFITASHVSKPKDQIVRGFKVAMLNEWGGNIQSLSKREIKVESLKAAREIFQNPDKVRAIEAVRKGTFTAENIDANVIRFNTLVGKMAAADVSLYELGEAIKKSEDPLAVLAQFEERYRDVDLPLKGMKIVVDGSHTPSGMLTAGTFRNLGAEVTSLNEDIREVSGMHKADPSIRANLKELEDKIIETGADFGMAFDLDGDRGVIHAPVRLLTTPETRFESLAPDNLITILLPSLKNEWGYNLLERRYGVIRDVLGTHGVNDRAAELGMEFYQTDAGYVFLKAKKEEEEKEGVIFPIYGERSGHIWLNVTGEIENPVAVGVLFAVLARREKKAFFDKRIQGAGLDEETIRPILDVIREKEVPYAQSPRVQPLFHPDLLTRLSEDERNTTGWHYDRNANVWHDGGGKSQKNPPQVIITLGRDVSIKVLKEEFVPGKTYTTPAGPLAVREFNDYLDPEEGLYRFADIVFEINGQFAGRFVFRASSNDPSFVASYETPIASKEEDVDLVRMRHAAIAGVVIDLLVSRNLAVVTKDDMARLFPPLTPAVLQEQYDKANLFLVEQNYRHYRKGVIPSGGIEKAGGTQVNISPDETQDLGEEKEVSSPIEDAEQDRGAMAFLTPTQKVLRVLENRWRRGQRGAISLAEIMDLTGLEKEFVLAALKAINSDFNISSFSVKPTGLTKNLDKETAWFELVLRQPRGESRPPQQGLRPGAASPLDKLPSTTLGTPFGRGTSSLHQGRSSSPLGASEDADEIDSMVENSGMPGSPSKSVKRERDYSPKSTEIQDPYKEIISDSRIPGSSPLGGINLDPALLDLQIKRGKDFVPLPLPQQPIDQMNIEGFIPVIINITPVTNLPMLLGLVDTPEGEDETMPVMKAREVEEISALN